MKKFSVGIVLALFGIIAFSLIMTPVKEGVENKKMPHNMTQVIKNFTPNDVKLSSSQLLTAINK